MMEKKTETIMLTHHSIKRGIMEEKMERTWKLPYENRVTRECIGVT